MEESPIYVFELDSFIIIISIPFMHMPSCCDCSLTKKEKWGILIH